MATSLESSFVYFGDVPDRLITGEQDSLGNVVAVPQDQLPAFMQTAAPATMEAWYGLHSPPTAARLGQLATTYLVSGRAIDVTDSARNIVVAARSLIDGLPDDFRLEFPGDDQQISLRLQMTSEGDLLLGVPQATEESLDMDSTPMLYALFGADGVLRDYSSVYEYPFRANGQRIDTETPSYVRDRARQAQGLAFWMDYLPTASQLIEASQAKDQGLIQQKLNDLRVALRGRDMAATPLGDLSTPDFISSLTDEQRENLVDYGQLPEDFIPPSLPGEYVLEEMRFSRIETVIQALERWGIPYTEVSYAAGVRSLNEINLAWAMVNHQLPGDFDPGFNLLPENFSRLGSRNQNDIYARIPVNGSDGNSIEREVLLYDGCGYTPELDETRPERIPRLSIPQEVRSYLAQSSPEHDLRRAEARPTTQIIRSDSWSIYKQGDGPVQQDTFSMNRLASEANESWIRLDGQSLPLTSEMRSRLKDVLTVGVGHYTRSRQELTVSYHRIGDALVPTVEGIRSVTERREPEVYKR